MTVFHAVASHCAPRDAKIDPHTYLNHTDFMVI